MKIVLVEDDSFYQKFYSKKLQEAGYEIIVAIDGEDGLEKIKLVLPDLVLLDIIMPKKDGFEVLQELGKNDVTKRIPVIVFSSLGQEKDVQKALLLGAKDYINKSFYDYAILLQKITNALKT